MDEALADAIEHSPLMRALYHDSAFPLAELERRALGAARLKCLFRNIPWHTEAAARDPDYWQSFYASRINS